jgi:hypothetical protein
MYRIYKFIDLFKGNSCFSYINTLFFDFVYLILTEKLILEQSHIKNKANSVFKVKREYIAKKLAIAWAILWNFYMILICVFLFILSVLIFRRIF